MSWTDDAFRANREYARAFSQGNLGKVPGHRLAIVACMDTRVDPLPILGLKPGDAHVIRNAGGRMTDDVLRSLIISSILLGTNEYLVIHHTDCGMQGIDNGELQASLTERTGQDYSHIDFLPFGDMAQSVRDDVALIEESPLLPDGITVRGCIYDVHTGLLAEVV